MNIQTITKFLGFMAVLSLMFMPSVANAWVDPEIRDFTIECDEDKNVHVDLISVTYYELVDVSTNDVLEEWEDRDQPEHDRLPVDFNLENGEYRLYVENYDGVVIEKTFTVNCEEPKEPSLSVQTMCEAGPGTGKVTVTAPNGLDSYELFKIPSPSVATGGTVAPGSTFSIKNLDNGEYRLESKLGNVFETDTPIIIDCQEEKEPELSIQTMCEAGPGTGKITVSAPNGLDSYELFNISNNSLIKSGSNVSPGSTFILENIDNGEYRLEGDLGSNSETITPININCKVDQPNDDLTGQCVVSPRNVETGEDVTWSASASGGDGSYTYSWDLEGSDDDADTRNITTQYPKKGTYSGTVEISDGDMVIQRKCNISVDNGGGGGGGGPLDPKDPDDDDDGRVRGDRDVFGVQCIPEKSAYLVGEVVTFNATVDGDIDEDDADFDWAGHSSIDEDDERATAQYTTPGIKEVSVRAEYNGDTERDTCYVQIARSGVTLDQVPYTGPGDMTKTIGFIMTLVLLSGIGGYAMIRRREETGIPVGIPTKNN